LEWPPQSPDLSPIEQIWDYVKSKMDTTERSSKEVMWKKIQKEWNKIPKKVLRKYILSLKSRCAACLNAKGYHTKY
jgi:transposase